MEKKESQEKLHAKDYVPDTLRANKKRPANIDNPGKKRGGCPNDRKKR